MVLLYTANILHREGSALFTILLSGGSGKRLWPLSNDLRSKQYLKLITAEDDPAQCSMVQRVWRQMARAGLDNRLICASSGQVEILKNQLGDVAIAVEPDRRDTFPAIALSCAYIYSMLGGTQEDTVCILPVDPYTEHTYFETLKTLETVLAQSKADIVLMGAVPDSPSEKYGYILPGASSGSYHEVAGFREKPDASTAQKLMQQGALWNCGVCCFRLGLIWEKLTPYGVPRDYEGLYACYDRLPRISFDYEVLEKASRLAVVPYRGKWSDLGTWSTLTEQMHNASFGNATLHACEQSHVINELDIPVIALGMENTVIVAAWDGILVTDRNASDGIKGIAQALPLKAMYEERRWGTIKTIDIAQNSEGFVQTRKIRMFEGYTSSYHFHEERDEAVTILRGRGELNLEGVTVSLRQGSTAMIPRGKRHAFRAYEDMEFIEIHIGKTMGDEDINRLTFDWAKIGEIEEGYRI